MTESLPIQETIQGIMNVYVSVSFLNAKQLSSFTKLSKQYILLH